jgi:hypothetical protein
MSVKPSRSPDESKLSTLVVKSRLWSFVMIKIKTCIWHFFISLAIVFMLRTKKSFIACIILCCALFIRCMLRCILNFSLSIGIIALLGSLLLIWLFIVKNFWFLQALIIQLLFIIILLLIFTYETMDWSWSWPSFFEGMVVFLYWWWLLRIWFLVLPFAIWALCDKVVTIIQKN